MRKPSPEITHRDKDSFQDSEDNDLFLLTTLLRQTELTDLNLVTELDNTTEILIMRDPPSPIGITMQFDMRRLLSEIPYLS